MRRVVGAAVVAGMLALGSPVASADSMGHLIGGCDASGVTDPAVTGQDTVEGVAHLILVGRAGESLTGRCVIRVSGSVRAATGWGSGTTVVTSVDRVTFTQAAGEVAQLCAQWSSSEGSGEACEGMTTTSVVPQDDLLAAVGEAYQLASDLLEYVVYNNAEPTVCDVTSRLGGTVGGPVAVTAEGDVYLVGTLLLDCAPYGGPKQKLPPPSGPAGIVINHFGNGLNWQRTGLLANTSLWSCSLNPPAPATVTCNWVASGTPPKCVSQYATAAVFVTAFPSPVWGKARARSQCDFNALDSAVADSANPFRHIGVSWAPPQPLAYVLRCRADNGANNAAVPQYVVDCDFQLS